jgi:hypothetical protein
MMPFSKMWDQYWWVFLLNPGVFLVMWALMEDD